MKYRIILAYFVDETYPSGISAIYHVECKSKWWILWKELGMSYDLSSAEDKIKSHVLQQKISKQTTVYYYNDNGERNIVAGFGES